MESTIWFIIELFTFGAGFLLFLVPCVVLAAWGIFHRSVAALGLSAALVLPTIFFLGLTPASSSVNGLPYSLVRTSVWASIALSPLVAIPGIWKQSRILLLVSAALSVPFGVWFLFYPGTRFYITLPVLHLIAAGTARTAAWWTSLVMLVGILGLELLFLFGFGGLGLLLGPAYR